MSITTDVELLALFVDGDLEGEMSLLLNVTVEGKNVLIEARKRMAAPHKTIMIELLKPGSTKEHPVLEPAALPCIRDAIARLVRTGELFATPLRLEWQEPKLMVWSLPGQK